MCFELLELDVSKTHISSEKYESTAYYHCISYFKTDIM